MLNINANISNSAPSNTTSTNRQSNLNPKATKEYKNKSSSPTVYSGSPDTIDISEAGMSQALQAQENDITGMLPQSDEDLLKTYQEQLDRMAKSKGKSNKGASEFAKIMKIARRIANGDIVPAYDEQKVMEFNPVLYQVAKAAAVLNMNKERESHKSLYEDEEQSNSDMQNMLETGQSGSSDTIVINEEDFIEESGV